MFRNVGIGLFTFLTNISVIYLLHFIIYISFIPLWCNVVLVGKILDVLVVRKAIRRLVGVFK